MDHRVVSIAPIDGAKSTTVDFGKAEVNRLRWAGPDYILAATTTIDKGVGQGADRKFTYRLTRDFVLTTGGKVITYLMKPNVESQLLMEMPVLLIRHGTQPQVTVVGLDWTPGALTINDTRFKRDQLFSSAVWQVDVATGAGHMVERGLPDTKKWAVDLDGTPRARVDYDDKGKTFDILVRPKDSATWRTLISLPDKIGAPELLGYSTPEDAVYLAEPQVDGSFQVIRHRLSDDVATDLGRAQQANMRFDPYSQAPLSVDRGGDDPSLLWLDPQLAEVCAKLSRAIPGKTIELVNWSMDRTLFVVAAESSDMPPEFFLLDEGRGQLSVIGERFPDLKGASLGTTTSFRYKARDGLEIPAYLTMPPASATPGSRPPLIVLPHDGPDSRDMSRFDWLVQFLASRGYAVLRPQYRGSAGFGVAFEKAGDHEWGGKIQTDLLDGVADLSKRGLVDPSRVCIIGFGFGGFTALAGETIHGDSYRCAVSINGMSDLPLLYGATTRHYTSDSDNVIQLKEWIGVSASAAAETATISPSRLASKSGGPILLIASAGGTEDVPYDQTNVMRDALLRAGRPVEILTLEDDDNLSTPATATRALESIEAFLAKNLPVIP